MEVDINKFVEKINKNVKNIKIGKNKIKEIPNVEEEKRAEYQAYECMAEEAFIAAKARFEELGPARKLKLILAGKDPDNIDISFKTVQEINKLYRKDERD